jgi:hypothetical protein
MSRDLPGFAVQEIDASPSQQPLLVFVGGFLGAGKTSLILKAVSILRDRGKRVAVIMNDQDAGLVDTQQSLALGHATREVAGGCFCCRFADLIDAAGQLALYNPEIIFAEPVGSCVDLSATILQPLQSLYRDTYRVAPLTVLLDPGMLGAFHRGEMHSDVEFLFRHQIAEGDLLCLTKIDAHRALPPSDFPIDFNLSARTGAGVEAWLDEVLDSARIVGARVLDVDYHRYAEAEAALGWLNLHADLHFSAPVSAAVVVGSLLDDLESELTRQETWIAHLKVFDRTRFGWVRASITANGAEPVPEGELLTDPALEHQLVVNLRALRDPAVLKEIVVALIQRLGAEVRIRHLGAFRPQPPVPTHRFSKPS